MNTSTIKNNIDKSKLIELLLLSDFDYYIYREMRKVESDSIDMSIDGMISGGVWDKVNWTHRTHINSKMVEYAD